MVAKKRKKKRSAAQKAATKRMLAARRKKQSAYADFQWGKGHYEKGGIALKKIKSHSRKKKDKKEIADMTIIQVRNLARKQQMLLEHAGLETGYTRLKDGRIYHDVD